MALTGWIHLLIRPLKSLCIWLCAKIGTDVSVILLVEIFDILLNRNFKYDLLALIFLRLPSFQKSQAESELS